MRARAQVHQLPPSSRPASQLGMTPSVERHRFTSPAISVAKVNATQTTPPVPASTFRMKLEQSPRRSGNTERILGFQSPPGYRFSQFGVAQGSSASTWPGSGSPSVGSTTLTSRGSFGSVTSPRAPPLASYVGPTSAVLSTNPPLESPRQLSNASSAPALKVTAVPALKVSAVPGCTNTHQRTTGTTVPSTNTHQRTQLRAFTLGKHTSQGQPVPPLSQRCSFDSVHNRQPPNGPVCTTPSGQAARATRASTPSTIGRRNSHGVPLITGLCRSIGSFSHR